MVYNVNQARQLFVVKTVTDGHSTENAKVANPGDLVYDATEKDFGISYMNAQKGVMRPFLYAPKCIKSVKLISADAASQKRLKNAYVIEWKSTGDGLINNGAPIIGEDYKINISIRQAFGDSDENSYFKYGIAHASYNMDGAAVMKELAKSLYYNQVRENVPFFDIYLGTTQVTASTVNNLTANVKITLVEAEQPFDLGRYAQTPVYFTAKVAPVTYLGEDADTWATVTKVDADHTTAITGLSGSPVAYVVNTHAIADLEYFTLGERGDIYRNIGWPKSLNIKYLVNVDNTTGYDIIEIVQKYKGDAEDIQESPMTLTFVAPKNTTNFSTLASALATYAGVTLVSVE